MRPLDRISSIKAKLVIVIVSAVAIAALVSTVGLRTGIPVWLRPPIAALIAMLLVYPFSRGITSPLREMVRASRSLARGETPAPVSATSRDEVGELARAFNDMQEQLVEAERQRRDLVANASHELRTPIAALRATLENLVDGVGEPDPELFASLLGQIERLGTLVDQLLDLSRLEAGESPLHVERCDARVIVVDAAEEAQLHRPGVPVEVTGRDEVWLVADRGRLRQVIANVLHNASRHSPDGHPVRVTLAGADGLDMTVVDEGPGIAEADRERVFERFYRSDHARSVDRGGAGLGLAISRWIVDLHGGSITIEDTGPVGCSVRVLVPSGRIDDEDEEEEDHDG